MCKKENAGQHIIAIRYVNTQAQFLMLMLTNPKPSSEVSNSTNAGVTADPCRRMSWGVVMDTRHLTRVRGTVLSSADRTRLRLMRYWPLSSAGVAKTLSGPKPSMDMVILSVKSGQTGYILDGPLTELAKPTSTVLSLRE